MFSDMAVLIILSLKIIAQENVLYFTLMLMSLLRLFVCQM